MSSQCYLVRAELCAGLFTLALLPAHVTIATLRAGSTLPCHVMTLLPCHAVTLLVTVTPPAASCAALTAVRAKIARATLTSPRDRVTHPCHIIGQPRKCQSGAVITLS